MSYLRVIVYFVAIIIVDVTGMNNDSEAFAVLTEGCAIKGFPLISESIRKFVGPPHNVRSCSDTAPLVKSNSSHLWLDERVFSYYNIWNENMLSCCYQNFSALSTINNISYEKCEEFSTIIKAEHEYVRIECYIEGDKIYEDYFVFNFNDYKYPTFFEKAEYNVLILGFESISRLNFHRTMPLTSQFLENKGNIELNGYNKLGDNSYPNLFPLLTGKSFDFIKKECINISTEAIDTRKCQFIWDKFKDRGYLTALGSDSIAGTLGHYEYRLPKIPTDFYLQPFVSETRNLFKDKYYNYHQCMGSKYYFKILIDHIYGLTKKLSSNNLFGLFWEESVSHEDINRPHIMDETYHNFLAALSSDGYLNNTILIVLSDHGMRWGDIILTDQGHLEERLPLLGILLPEDFRRRYKLAFRNIQKNSNRITTPFDVHATLLHLLDPHTLSNRLIRHRTDLKMTINNHSSLFLPISGRRTCESIGIDEHWCACYKGKKLRPGPKMKPLVSEILITHINDLISSHPECHKLTLEKILHVALTENDKSWRIYTVIVQTTPGGGIFDGTLIRSPSTWRVSGTVSRLNLYRNQSSCIEDPLAKMYCFCAY